VTAGSLRTPLSLAVEVLWSFAAVVLFVTVFGQDDGPAPSIITVAVTVLASFALARVLQPVNEASDEHRTQGVAISIIALVTITHLTYASPPWDLSWLSTLITNPAEAIEPNGHVVAAFAALFAVWLRGVQRGSLPEIEFEGALQSVSVGFVFVVIAALATPDVQGDISWSALAFAYAIIAILTLAIFNTSPGVQLASLARGWPLAIGSLAGLALLLALVAGTIDRDAFDAFEPLVAPTEATGRVLRDYVLAPIFWVIALPFHLFAWLIGLFVPDDQPLRPIPEQPAEEERQLDEDEPLWFRILLAIGAVLGVGIAITIALLLLWYAFRRYMRFRARDARELREDVEPESTLSLDLVAMLGSLGRRFRRERTPDAIPIRRLYFDLLDAAEDRGLERPPYATPLQFAPTLDARFGSSVPSQISAAFVESRYAGRDLPPDRVHTLQERWRLARDAAPP
jgi:hypothetical protein